MTEQTDEEFDAPYTEGEDPLAVKVKPALPPVQITGDAVKALSGKMREWSGWPDSRVVFATPDPRVSAHASTTHEDRTFTVNPDTLILNPNRVLATITPFRLRQEAVLTGALLHEAGHARHTHWRPRTEEEAKAFTLGNGEPVREQVFDLAMLMEEPRVEALQARDELSIGAYGLAWTMQASAAHLLPMTEVSRDPAQAMMDVLKSWALRAGRQIGLQKRAHHRPRNWVGDFTALLAEAIEQHLATEEVPPPQITALRQRAINLLLDMIVCDDDTGTTMVDLADKVYRTLFHKTPPEDQPSPGAGCAGGEGAPGESGASPSPNDAQGKSEKPEPTEQQKKQMEQMASALSKEEEKADTDVEAESNAEQSSPPPEPPRGQDDGGLSGGEGRGARHHEYRLPTKEERETQKRAEHFLRSLIDPSEGSKVSLTETPSATVDGAALAAWKAGGQIRDPQFFVRTRRESTPQPPVKIAILVDISSSMGVLQKPSALLSWALSAAAFDLRNFAGRGVQIESTLIHWGSDDPVLVAGVGQLIPGIREVHCNEGTTAMAAALDLVEEQMPGFFDASKVSNRLLVQFTDWELWGGSAGRAVDKCAAALNAGVNMLTVAPSDYSGRSALLSDVLRKAPFGVGKSMLMEYNKAVPEAVWDRAAELLA